MWTVSLQLKLTKFLGRVFREGKLHPESMQNDSCGAEWIFDNDYTRARSS